MTYLEALRRKLGVDTIDEMLHYAETTCPEDAPPECDNNMPRTISRFFPNCWICWLRQAPEPVVHEEVETIYPCTVQIIRNPETGKESVGWFRGQILTEEADSE